MKRFKMIWELHKIARDGEIGDKRYYTCLQVTMATNKVYNYLPKYTNTLYYSMLPDKFIFLNPNKRVRAKLRKKALFKYSLIVLINGVNYGR